MAARKRRRKVRRTRKTRRTSKGRKKTRKTTARKTRKKSRKKSAKKSRKRSITKMSLAQLKKAQVSIAKMIHKKTGSLGVVKRRRHTADDVSEVY